MATLPLHPPIHIPTLALIPGGFRPGYMIRIKGLMRSSGQRFTIDLQCGPALTPLDDIPLHLSIRPNEFAIVRNHHEKYRWGVEERSGGCPIRRGHAYEILILAETTGYKIAIDGRHYCDFRHRIPLHRVSYIHISGDTDVNLVGYETDKGTPVPFQPPPSSQGHHHHHHHHNHRPCSPPRSGSPVMVMPIAPTAPPVPIPGIIAAPYPGPQSKPLYPNLTTPTPMPMPMLVPNPPPPPPYSVQPPYGPQAPYTPQPPPYNPQTPYIHQPIETCPYPQPYNPTPYPTQQPIQTIQAHTYTSNPNPGYVATSQTSYPANISYVAQEKKKNKHTALKVAAAAGGIGLGAYAISRAFRSSSSSDSD